MATYKFGMENKLYRLVSLENGDTPPYQEIRQPQINFSENQLLEIKNADGTESLHRAQGEARHFPYIARDGMLRIRKDFGRFTKRLWVQSRSGSLVPYLLPASWCEADGWRYLRVGDAENCELCGDKYIQYAFILTRE